MLSQPRGVIVRLLEYPLCWALSAWALCFPAVLGGSSAHALPSNGGFESSTVDLGSNFVDLSAGSTAIDNWIVDSGSIGYVGGYWQPSEGDRSIDMNGFSKGAISQALATPLNSVYRVFFDIAGNPDSGPTIKTLQVTAGDAAEEFVFDTTGRNRGDMGWEGRSFVFTAIDTTTTLAFVSTTDGAYGAAIDDVRIALIPEPATAILLSAGLAGLAMRRRVTSEVLRG